MTVTPANLRTDFPEFASETDYPTSTMQYWIDVAGLMLNAKRWPTRTSPNTGRSILDLGTELFTAHNLVLERNNQRAAVRGGAPGARPGVIASEAGAGVSVSYDTGGGINPNDGHWNTTTFGTRFMELVRMVGAGPITIAGCAPPAGTVTGPAWPGPNGGYLYGQSW